MRLLFYTPLKYFQGPGYPLDIFLRDVLYVKYFNDANKNFKIDKSLLNKIRIIKIR